jgi:hypothetical protein
MKTKLMRRLCRGEIIREGDVRIDDLYHREVKRRRVVTPSPEIRLTLKQADFVSAVIWLANRKYGFTPEEKRMVAAIERKFVVVKSQIANRKSKIRRAKPCTR